MQGELDLLTSSILAHRALTRHIHSKKHRDRPLQSTSQTTAVSTIFLSTLNILSLSNVSRIYIDAHPICHHIAVAKWLCTSIDNDLLHETMQHQTNPGSASTITFKTRCSCRLCLRIASWINAADPSVTNTQPRTLHPPKTANRRSILI